MFSFARQPGVKPDNAAVRQAVREKTPLVLFGSYNERMYLAERNFRKTRRRFIMGALLRLDYKY